MEVAAGWSPRLVGIPRCCCSDDLRGYPHMADQPFGRVYAAYGGFFIVLSLLWGWRFDGNRPDRADVIGATIALIGVCLMMYWPRGSSR